MNGKTRIAGTILLIFRGLLQAQAPTPDPPSRVARLNYTAGAVSFRPASVQDWAPATLNYPLTTGDNLWADRNSRAELHVGSASVRLAAETSFGFLNLDDRTMQVSVSQGSLQIRLRELAQDETVEVDTPNVAISLLRPGEYRIDANPDNQTTLVSVRTGEAELTAAGQAIPVHARQAARLTGTDSPTQEVFAEGPADEFDRWAEARDLREDQSVSARYVGREMNGYEDLDQYGQWSTSPDYGPVWIPAGMPAGWAPYRFGHWVWVEPWGWTWVDDAPWGFAPFHYGRWASVRGTWGWIPGRMVARPVYAPALVAFVGGGRFSVGVTVGGGPVGWFPLGPREVFVPSYHVSPVYVRNVNITHVTNINVTNVYNARNVTYLNQRTPGAVTVVSRETFVGARPVGRAVVVVPANSLASARVIGTAPTIAPRRESIVAIGAPGGRAIAAPPARVFRPVVTRTAPPPAAVPFTARQQALEAHPGRPLDAAAMNRLRASQPAMRNPMVHTEVQPTPQAVRPAPQAVQPAPHERRPETQEVRPAPQAVRPEAPPSIRQPQRVEPERAPHPAPNAVPHGNLPRPNQPPAQPIRPSERPQTAPPQRAEPERAPRPAPNAAPQHEGGPPHPQPQQHERRPENRERPQNKDKSPRVQ